MTNKERAEQIAKLKKSLEWWTAKRAEAITAGDAEALTEAEAGRNNTLSELLKLQPKSRH